MPDGQRPISSAAERHLPRPAYSPLLGRRRRRARLWLAAAAVMAMCAPGWAGDFPPHRFAAEANGFVEFSTPSNNIGCFYAHDGDGFNLTCDRAEPLYIRFVLASRGRAKLYKNPGEQPCCSGDPLPYGESWREGPFECDSTADGLSCESDSGHGFFISRARYEVH